MGLSEVHMGLTSGSTSAMGLFLLLGVAGDAILDSQDLTFKITDTWRGQLYKRWSREHITEFRG